MTSSLSLMRLVGHLVVAGAFLIGPASAQPPVEPSPRLRSERQQRPMEYWLQQLDDDQFSRRQVATHHLNQMGQAAVEPLVLVAQSGKLELTQRAIGILQSLAREQQPDDEGGAWAALGGLVSQGSGSAAVGARAAIEDIRRERESQAYAKLAAAGVEIGYRDFVVQNRPLNLEIVWIGNKFKGDTDALRWLRWVTRIEHAQVEGTAVRQEVLQHVVQMPDLRTLVLRDATVHDDIFTALSKLIKIDDLEFRYINLAPEDAEKIAKLPIRVSLSMMGTGMPEAAVEQIRQSLPGVNVVDKRGGFLGISSHSLSHRCQIDSVKVGSAAAKAGLQNGDVVIQIDDTPIATFEDLQKKIGNYYAGDEIEMTFERFGEIDKVTVTLGREGGQ